MTQSINSIEYGEPVSFAVEPSDDLVRLDKTLSQALSEYSRSFVQGLFADGLVMCNGIQVQKNHKPRQGDIVSFTVPEPKELSVRAEDIPLNIMYEDGELLVVNKPQGMVVHPAPGNYEGTLVNALLWHCKGNLSGINGVIRPGIVHRIDKDTSGLLLVAKTDAAHASLAQQIKEHSLDREYRAVICGKLKEKSGVVDAPIGRSTADRKKMCVTDKNSKNAVTHYEVGIQRLFLCASEARDGQDAPDKSSYGLSRSPRCGRPALWLKGSLRDAPRAVPPCGAYRLHSPDNGGEDTS